MLYLEFYYFWGYLWIFIVLIIILAFMIHIGMAVWTYRDAQKRNMDAAIWVLIVLLFSLLAVIIYVIVRNPLPHEKKAQKRYTLQPVQYYQQPQPVQYYQQPEPMPQYTAPPKVNVVKYCVACGKKMSGEARFCPHCGRQI